MRLGVNARRLVEMKTGVGRHLEYILNLWSKENVPFSEIILYTHRVLNDQDLHLSERFRNEVIPSSLPNLVWENVLVPRKLHDIDVLLCPSYTIPYGYHGKSVVIVHGVQEAAQQLFGWWSKIRYTTHRKYSALHASRVIAVSETVKQDIIECFGTDADRIDVVYNGVDRIFRPLEDRSQVEAIRKKYRLGSEPYIIFVGKLSKRRHIPELIEAHTVLCKQYDHPHRLLIVGPNLLGQDIQRLIDRYSSSDRVRYIDYASHNELALLYNGADMSVYPSDYEGFGLPVIEAMACGVPVITLKKAALKEIAKDASILLDHCTVNGLIESMHILITHETLRKELVAAGLERARKFSWDDAAVQIMDILERVSRE